MNSEIEQLSPTQRFERVSDQLHDWLTVKNAFWSRMQGNTQIQRVPAMGGEFRYGQGSMGVWEFAKGLHFHIHYKPQTGTDQEIFRVKYTAKKVWGRYQYPNDKIEWVFANGLSTEDKALNYKVLSHALSDEKGYHPMIAGVYEEMPSEVYKRNGSEELFSDFWIRDQFERFVDGVQRVDAFDKFQELIDHLQSAKQICKNPPPIIPFDDLHIALLRRLLSRTGLDRIVKI